MISTENKSYNIYGIAYEAGDREIIDILYYDRGEILKTNDKDKGSQIIDLREHRDKVDYRARIFYLGLFTVHPTDNHHWCVVEYVRGILGEKLTDDSCFIDVTHTKPKFRDEFIIEPHFTEEVYPENKWHRRFMDVAKMVATWSKDPSTKVGAALVKDNRIVATGYNGWPAHMDDDLYLSQWESNQEYARALKNKYTIHAERNAIEHAIGDVKGSTLYITHPPCTSCTDYLIEKGISHVVVLDSDDERFLSVWNCEDSFDRLSDALIPVIKLKETK